MSIKKSQFYGHYQSFVQKGIGVKYKNSDLSPT